jgi:hypothetical protein
MLNYISLGRWEPRETFFEAIYPLLIDFWASTSLGVYLEPNVNMYKTGASFKSSQQYRGKANLFVEMSAHINVSQRARGCCLFVYGKRNMDGQTTQRVVVLEILR